MPQFCSLFYAILQSWRPKGGGPWPPSKYAPAWTPYQWTYRTTIGFSTKDKVLIIYVTTMNFGRHFSKFRNIRILFVKLFPSFLHMPTTYLCEQGFSALVEIKSNKTIEIKNFNTLMREALEPRLLPRVSQPADKIQQQRLHWMPVEMI